MDHIFVNALYAAFAAKEEKFTEAGYPPVRHIDKMRGQPLNPEQFEGFELPAVFFGMRCEWEQQGKLYNGNMTIDFHVVQDATWEISSIATNNQEGLKQINFLQLVRYVLDNLSSPVTSKLKRFAENPVDSGVTIYDMLTYTCTYSDRTIIGTVPTVEVTPGLNVNGKLVTHLTDENTIPPPPVDLPPSPPDVPEE
jgi:hypothetical protein